MTSLPLRRVSISNFRRLSGTVELPLDAPVVLIHGPNGTGKTSILSAIELALTGAVESLARVDDRYMAHLPLFGRSFAAVEIQVADQDGVTRSGGVMTVGGGGLKGEPAFDPATRQFFSERCYLDQASLGRLLEIYQHSDKNRESSLTRFVDELLGLDDLDALISGLVDVTDVRRIRKLVDEYASATAESDSLDATLKAAGARQRVLNNEIADSIKVVELMLQELGAAPLEDVSLEGVTKARKTCDRELSERGSLDLDQVWRELAELKGRLDGVATQRSHRTLVEARSRAANLESELHQWRVSNDAVIAGLRDEALALDTWQPSRSLNDLETLEDLRETLSTQRSSLRDVYRRREEIASALENARAEFAKTTELAGAFTSQLTSGEQRAGILASALASLRGELQGDTCPVCDRDFSEVGRGHLVGHLDTKISELAAEGESLSTIRRQRDAANAQLAQLSRQRDNLYSQIAAMPELDDLERRQDVVNALSASLEGVWPTIEIGLQLLQDARAAAIEASDLESQAGEVGSIEARLHEIARQLDEQLSDVTAAPTLELAERLARVVSERRSEFAARQKLLQNLRADMSSVEARLSELASLKLAIATDVEHKLALDARISEAEARRERAKALRVAASDTRAAIVERVFNESLNGVWRDVFVRLAPNEPFVPAFGVPEAGKHVLNISLETIHRGGGSGGAPGAMLSAGNLNTAALSLFLALHLVVEPKVPCLVLDDPIQAMDEVHISQFAALLRLLSKQHERQVVIAVHERELFEYLSLELSPAFEGDELITIELSSQQESEPVVAIKRVGWTADVAIAV